MLFNSLCFQPLFTDGKAGCPPSELSTPPKSRVSIRRVVPAVEIIRTVAAVKVRQQS